MGDKDRAVVEACTDAWGESWSQYVGGNSGNCSGFFKSVAKKLNIAGVPDDVADTIVDQLTKAWKTIDGGSQAREMVRQGYFVGAGLESSEQTPRTRKDETGKVVTVPVKQGHVAVVVDGELYREKYPRCWCGSTGAAQSKGDLSIGEIFAASDRDKVRYFMYPSKVASDSK